jgi:hypothetical protein
MQFIPLDDLAARQLIDATTVYGEYRRVRGRAAAYAGGMYWKATGATQSLVKTSPDNRQRRLGPRNSQTESIYAEFKQRKAELEGRLRSLRAALTEAERMNRAVKAGRTPSLVVGLLNALDDAGLGDHFTVVGTHALYAYESAAGVRIVPDALATQDVDLLWDARKRVQFMTTMTRLDTSVLKLLQRVDATFERKDGHNETAINARGFEVDFLRRPPEGDDPHPFRFTDDEADLWPVQALRAGVLTNATPFEHPVVSATGRMSQMRTIAPGTFVDFKRWLSTQSSQRPQAKRLRDARQADIVQALLSEGLLVAPGTAPY